MSDGRYASAWQPSLCRKHHQGTLLVIEPLHPVVGGSNDIANLFPEKLHAHPGYRVKDRLENRLHDLVCEGRMTLLAVRRGIASDWQKLYRRVYGVAPSG